VAEQPQSVTEETCELDYSGRYSLSSIKIDSIDATIRNGLNVSDELLPDRSTNGTSKATIVVRDSECRIGVNAKSHR
jgi:hypothetical protein